MKNHNIISVSGGKDSTATLLLAIERGAENMQPVFADTGHEHRMTYDYLDYLEQRLGLVIRRIKPDFSGRIMAKRDYVNTVWRAELPEEFMAGKPGKWKLKKGYVATYNNGHTVDDDDELGEAEALSEPKRAMLKTPGGHLVGMPEIPPEPADPYSSAESGVFFWMPATRPMAPDQAQHTAGVIIERALSVLVPTGNPFLDLCLWKGRFPSTMARFCTEELKRNPMAEQVLAPLLSDPNTGEVWSWQGVRADESPKRAKLPEMDEVSDGLINYRPILRWSAADVFDFHRKHGVKWNPLYEQGMGRVGCMPCINCRKDELREIAQRFPSEIERVAEWERLVSMASKRCGSSFFGPSKMPTNIDGKSIEEAQEILNIDNVVRWSMTGKGGHTFDMLAMMAPDEGCSSVYGLCESYSSDRIAINLEDNA